jgi:serine/threonine protein phosphatase PrpC
MSELIDSCPSCGLVNRPEARFCSRCGSSLANLPDEQRVAPHDPQMLPTVAETAATDEPFNSSADNEAPLMNEIPDLGGAGVGEEGAATAVSPTVPLEGGVLSPASADPAGYVRLRFGFQSDKGQIREINEDAILTVALSAMFNNECRATLGLFAVADGIGGHEGGEIASRETIQFISGRVMERIFTFIMSNSDGVSKSGRLTGAFKKAIEQANEKIYKLRQERDNDMGSTVTAVLVHNTTAVVANVGDSRTYLWRDGKLEQKSRDHSLVASLIEAQQLPPEAIYTHEQKSVIYRSLGDKPKVEVDMFPLTLQREDRLILCSDGVWEMIRDEGIEAVLLLEADPQRACDEMTRRANLAGGEDNISVAIVVVDPA